MARRPSDGDIKPEDLASLAKLEADFSREDSNRRQGSSKRPEPETSDPDNPPPEDQTPEPATADPGEPPDEPAEFIVGAHAIDEAGEGADGDQTELIRLQTALIERLVMILEKWDGAT